MKKVKLLAEIEIKFDYLAPEKIDLREIKNAIQNAVSECSQIENVASVRAKAIVSKEPSK